jgi:PAS domain S-box-containing protein
MTQTRLVRLSVAGSTNRAVFLSGRSQVLLRGITEAVFLTTPQGRVLEANQAAVDLAGGTADLVGRACLDAFGFRHDTALLDCRVCPLAGTPGRDLEVWTDAPDGQRVTLLARVQPVVDRSGTIVEILHTLRDVSEIARAREAENTFLATTSHELKTPLTVIRGSAETLRDRPGLPVDLHDRLLEAIIGRARDLDQTVTRLLQASRLRAGAEEVVLTEVDTVPVLAERVRAIDEASPDHRFTFHAPDRVPAVMGNARAVGVVIDHLLENARKYQPDGGLVDVRLHVDDVYLSIGVRDHGIGMTAEQQRRCFDRFWQGRAGDDRPYGGTGVGLYLVRELVRSMGGVVDVWSQLGRGSQFTVHLLRVDRLPTGPEPTVAQASRGRTMIDEFMRQVGVGAGAGNGAASGGVD